MIDNNYIYFGTIDHGYMDNYGISRTIRIVYGIDVKADDFDQIRKYAKEMKGITKELDNPSVEYLVEHDHSVLAVKLAKDLHPTWDFTKARDYVREFERQKALRDNAAKQRKEFGYV